MKDKILYLESGIMISVTDPFADMPKYMQDRMRNTTTMIHIYRVGDYEFESLMTMNRYGRESTIRIFESIGLPVYFDVGSRTYKISEEKDRFKFILEYGSYKSE